MLLKLEETRATESGNTNALCGSFCSSEEEEGKAEEEEEKCITAKLRTSAWLIANLCSIIFGKIACCNTHPCQVMKVNIHPVLIASGIFSVILEFWIGIP